MPSPPVRPDPMAPPHRRPRAMDPSQHVCPPAGCDSHGGLGLGTLRANGHPRGGPWRPFPCPACGGDCLETHGTLLQGQRAAVELMVRGLACFAEGWGLRATARVWEVDPHTVRGW
jgi:hypothetical protein